MERFRLRVIDKQLTDSCSVLIDEYFPVPRTDNIDSSQDLFLSESLSL